MVRNPTQNGCPFQIWKLPINHLTAPIIISSRFNDFPPTIQLAGDPPVSKIPVRRRIGKENADDDDDDALPCLGVFVLPSPQLVIMDSPTPVAPNQDFRNCGLLAFLFALALAEGGRDSASSERRAGWASYRRHTVPYCTLPTVPYLAYALIAGLYDEKLVRRSWIGLGRGQ